MKNQSSIYFDTNVYRRITRILAHWQKFENFMDQKEPDLLDNTTVLFTWSQVLEASDLGQIMNYIAQTKVWKEVIEGKKLFDQLQSPEALNKYFETALKAIQTLPQLQKNALLKNINKAISSTCKEAHKLVQNTLGRYRDFVVSDNYMQQLSQELAWAFLTSYSFIKSGKQWEKRRLVYENLMTLWHKFTKEGYDLVFFRLCERQYHSYLLYSPDVDLEKAKVSYPNINTRQDLVNEIFKFPLLKQGSDLCDGEIMDSSYLGNKGTPVIGITMDQHPIIQQRGGILSRSLTDLKNCISGWNIEICLGKIFCLEITQDGTINRAYSNLPLITLLP